MKEDYLTEWMYTYIENKDLITKKIRNVKKINGLLTIFMKDDSEKTYKIFPEIDSFAKHLENGKEICIVILNNKKNLDILVKEWDLVKKEAKLSVFFVNPFSDLEMRWIIYPSTHARICDDESLSVGLISMFETVTEIYADEFNKLSQSTARQG